MWQYHYQIEVSGLANVPHTQVEDLIPGSRSYSSPEKYENLRDLQKPDFDFIFALQIRRV